ncbi:dTDP-4-dehydrorhamnose reductase [Duganella sp. SG902]|uniref:sugar nucleotide-binding protein n=1 Tax=Duganella sp. SG902 TaxID=2587016 RepID=UPI00159D1AE1|nr:sugar nucleotide-binding protein [Duganella sp. SG902]NVM77964.1 dTDP-4-dehydrorhamnose reductase [Duganella sp. SG902]
MSKTTDDHTPPLELWGGLEATVNRVRDRYFSQMEQNGHDKRISDLDRFAALGITALRYPVLWELIAPDGLERANWSWPDERLPALRALGITPIAGLVHHGSGPRHTSLVDPGFAEQLAAYAGAVARRYPWLEYYTPVNEPCTTARFSGLYGLWYPHEQSDRSFVRALLNQCRGVALSMQAIRKINPAAKLIQTDDLGKTYSTPPLAHTAAFYNQRRWLPWDLLCGMVVPGHALWAYLLEHGASVAELRWFAEHPCPPDIIGVNYYITSERWLDHRAEHYAPGEVGAEGYADIVAARALATPRPGIGPLLEEAWRRYRLPLAVTEAHIDAPREDHLRWLAEIWHAAQQARRRDIDVRAVTVWSLLGSFDWNCLVTECKGYYETGPYDLRGPEPRATALATLMRELASGRPPSSPVLQGHGWWRRPQRLLYPASHIEDADPWHDLLPSAGTAQPLLIAGASGALGRTFARLCAERHLACLPLTRQEMDIANPAAVEAAICRYRPWAIVNAGGYVPRPGSDYDAERCQRDNVQGPVILAAACARHGIGLLSFSSDQVFDGARDRPYVESDPVTPSGAHGRNKAEAERRVLAMYPAALLVRTSALFGPGDPPGLAAGDLAASPTYLPDLAHACLDLLIDRESGLWHLSNPGGGGRATLGSERGQLLPPLEDAIQRFLASQP